VLRFYGLGAMTQLGLAVGFGLGAMTQLGLGVESSTPWFCD
jgi:hypothetical protein